MVDGRATPGRRRTDVAVRPYRVGDAAAMVDVFRRAVDETAPRDYTVEQATAWASHGPDSDATARRAGDGRWTFVAEHPELGVVGYVDLEPDGHLDHLYCSPDVVGTGVGAMLVDEVERCARAHGITRIRVEASEAARRVFERRGYRVVRRNDIDLAGVAIHNYDMEGDLA
jgi:putative acetyltransferase